MSDDPKDARPGFWVAPPPPPEPDAEAATPEVADATPVGWAALPAEELIPGPDGTFAVAAERAGEPEPADPAMAPDVSPDAPLPPDVAGGVMPPLPPDVPDTDRDTAPQAVDDGFAWPPVVLEPAALGLVTSPPVASDPAPLQLELPVEEAGDPGTASASAHDDVAIAFDVRDDPDIELPEPDDENVSVAVGAGDDPATGVSSEILPGPILDVGDALDIDIPAPSPVGVAAAALAGAASQPAVGSEPVSSVPEVFSTPARWSRLRLGRRFATVAAAALALLMLGGAGASYAAFDLGRDYAGRILPGATIAGVDVGGMSRDRAIAVVSGALEPRLARTMVVQWGDRKWKVTPAKLGARNDAEEAVDAALEASGGTSLLERARMRVLGDDFAFDRPVAITYPRTQVRGFVEGLASAFDREPEDASLDSSTGWIEVRKERVGRDVRVARSTRLLLAGLREGSTHVPLAVDVTEPEVTTDDFGKMLLLRIGENKLYLYEHGKIIRTWTVATGQPSYPTPTGVYEITEKRYMPTWINPAPDGWGASMPPSIGPGIGNPLGLRALNWSAPAIRFHGTSATYSLGYNASHGCVRMANSDVIELYDLVEVGTPIVSVIAGPLRPMYSSSPDPVPAAENSAG